MFSPAGAGPDRGQAVVGFFLANQVLREVGAQEGAIVLLFPPENIWDAETVGAYAGTFSRVLRGFPDLKVQVRTLAARTKAARAGQIPLSAFQSACSNASPALAYVSFAGVPPDIEKLQLAGVSRTPPFFVFDPSATTNWLSALKNGRIKTVIVPRPDVHHVAGDEISGEPQEVFNRLYLLATPTTAEETAAKLRTRRN